METAGAIYAANAPEFEYILTFAPICFCHVIVPTLSYFAGTERSDLMNDIYEHFPYFNKNDVINMMLCPAKHVFPRNYQFVTYLFVHATYSHMFGNLYTAFVCGRPVWQAYGSFKFLILYLSGGIISSLPSRVSIKHKEHLDNMIADTFEMKDKTPVPDLFKAVWNTWAPSIGKSIISLQLPTHLCGSSGATCALVGASMVIGINDLIHSPFLRRFVSRNTTNSTSNPNSNLNSNHDSTSRRDSSIPSSALQSRLYNDIYGIKFMNHISVILTSFGYLVSEYELMYPSARSLNSSSFQERISDILERSKIGHVAHVQGAVYGVVFSVFFTFVYPHVVKYSSGGVII